MRVCSTPAFVVSAALLASQVAHAAPPRPEPSAAAAPVRAIDFPLNPGAGAPREAKVLVDEPALKLVSIVLRKRTVLPPHESAVPVTIMALQGSGILVAGTQRIRLDAAHAVMLAPHVSHAVEPDEGNDMVLLVHHLGATGEKHP